MLVNAGIYGVSLVALLILCGVALAGQLLPGKSTVGKVMRLATMFGTMNAALLVGFFRWAKRKAAGRLGADCSLAAMLYACVLLYVSLIYIRPAEIVPAWATIPFVDILSGISAVIAVFSLSARPGLFRTAQDKLLVAFWGFIVVFDARIWVVLDFASWLAFMPVVFVYFLIRAGVRTQAQLNGVDLPARGLNVFLAVNGIVQYHTGMGLGNITTRNDRIYGMGIFNDPNDLGMTFVMAVPLVLTVIGYKGGWLIARLMAVVSLVLIVLAIYYTNSRGTLVGLAGALIFYAFQKYRTMSATFAALVLMAAIGIAAPSRGGDMDYGESSAQSRIHSWAEGWVMLKSSPLTGVGYGQYTEHHIKVAHNSFVNTFAELGLLGAFCFVGMFYWYFKGLRLIPDTNTEFVRWRRALVVSAVGAMACGWFLSRQYVPLFYILLALGGSAVNLQVPAESRATLKSNRNDVMAIGGLMFLGLAIIYFSIRTMAIWGG